MLSVGIKTNPRFFHVLFPICWTSFLTFFFNDFSYEICAIEIGPRANNGAIIIANTGTKKMKIGNPPSGGEVKTN